MPTLKTIRQAASTKILSEHHLRILVAEGRCPGIYVGNRFLINMEALSEMLDQQSRKSVEKGGDASGSEANVFISRG